MIARAMHARGIRRFVLANMDVGHTDIRVIRMNITLIMMLVYFVSSLSVRRHTLDIGVSLLANTRKKDIYSIDMMDMSTAITRCRATKYALLFVGIMTETSAFQSGKENQTLAAVAIDAQAKTLAMFVLECFVTALCIKGQRAHCTPPYAVQWKHKQQTRPG